MAVPLRRREASTEALEAGPNPAPSPALPVAVCDARPRLAELEQVGQAALHKGGDGEAFPRSLGEGDLDAAEHAGLGGGVRLEEGLERSEL